MHRWKHLYEGQLRLDMNEVLTSMVEGFDAIAEEDPSTENMIDAVEAAQQLCLHMIRELDKIEKRKDI